MSIRIKILALVLSVGVACPLLAQAPQSSNGLSVAEQNAVGKKKDPNDRAKEYIKIANQKAVDARKAADRGDAKGLDESLRGHEAAMQGAMRTIHDGESSGQDMSRAWEAVDRGTSKHTEVLTNVLSRVPDQAKPGIQRALDSSQRGHDTALQSLEKARQERAARGKSELQGGSSMTNRGAGRLSDDVFDRGVGRSGSVGAGRSAGASDGSAGRGRGR
jgi:hypothetical protein